MENSADLDAADQHRPGLNGEQHQHTAPDTVTVWTDRVQGRVQAMRLQRFAYDAAMALREACTEAATGKVTMDVKTAVAVQKLIGAWDIAADRLRVLRGRGLPAAERKTRRSPSQVEPLVKP